MRAGDRLNALAGSCEVPQVLRLRVHDRGDDLVLPGVAVVLGNGDLRLHHIMVIDVIAVLAGVGKAHAEALHVEVEDRACLMIDDVGRIGVAFLFVAVHARDALVDVGLRAPGHSSVRGALLDNGVRVR